MASLKTFSFIDGVLRFYDGTATPFYVELPFMGANFTAPLGVDRPAEVSIMNRGRLRNTDTNWHYISGPDDPVVSPETMTFSARLGNSEPSRTKLRQILNLDMGTTWTVGANTWVTTKGKSQLLSGGETPVLVTTPLFADARKRCVDVQILWADPDGSSDIGYRWQEVYFPPNQQTVTEGADIVDIRLSGQIYGAISAITAFTAGTLG